MGYSLEFTERVRVVIGMSHDEPRLRNQTIVQPVNDSGSRGPVEVDHHVAAQNQVEREKAVQPRGRLMLDEVVILETDALLIAVGDPPVVPVGDEAPFANFVRR